MASNDTPNPLGAASMQPRMNEQPASNSTPGTADQAREAVRNVRDQASDTLSDVSKRSTDYYRQGSQAVGDVGSTAMVSMFIAGAVCFGIGWLALRKQSHSRDYVARRMGYGSERDF